MSDERTAHDEQPAEESTLSDDLLAAYDALEGEEEEHDNDAPESGAETESSEEEAAPEETQASGDSEAVESEQEESEDDPAIEPPQHWSAEHKEMFAKIPKEAQEFVLQRHRDMEADYTRKSQEVAEVRKALEPIKQQLELNGMSEGEYVTRLRAADQYLAQQPKEAIKWLAQNYGIDLREFGQGEGSEFDDDKDPYVQKLEEKVSQLESKLTQRETSEQQASQQQLQQQIQDFQAEKDEQGNLKHPHFDSVRTHMGALMQSGAAQTMEEAYEQAVWARPDLRQELIEAQKREAAQQEQQRRKEKAQKAKKAATPSGSGSTAPSGEEPGKNWKEELERQFDKLAS